MTSVLEERVEQVQLALSQPFWHTATGMSTAVVATTTSTDTKTVDTTAAAATAAMPPNPLLTNVVTQLQSLLTLLPTIDNDPFDYFVTNWPSLLISCSDPLSAALALVATPTMKRRQGDRVDLLALLLRAVHEITMSVDGDDDDDDGDGEEATPKRNLLTAEMTAQATELCKR
jgi:hypothetical protein